MKKEQPVLSDTSIPDALNAFAKKIAQKSSVHGDESKLTAKELLTALMPVRKPLGCLPVITSFDKCNKLEDDVKKPLKDFIDSNSDARVNATLRKVFHNIEEEMGEGDSETQSTTSLTHELELSFDGKWLRKCFKVPLRMAVKEILSRKPYDPIGYLGFCLLNYRRCQEISQLQLEADNELNYYRSMIKEPIFKREEVSVDRGEEEEEEIHDWNFKHYETARMSK